MSLPDERRSDIYIYILIVQSIFSTVIRQESLSSEAGDGDEGAGGPLVMEEVFCAVHDRVGVNL